VLPARGELSRPAAHEVDESGGDRHLEDDGEDADAEQTPDQASHKSADETDTQGPPGADRIRTRHDESAQAADDESHDDEADEVTDDAHEDSFVGERMFGIRTG